MIAALIGVGGFAAGVIATLIALNQRAGAPTARPIDAVEVTDDPARGATDDLVAVLEPAGANPEPARGALHLVTLIGDALRKPLHRLRRDGAEAALIAEFEHVGWQARMLTSRPRPMQAQPVSAIALLQEAAEQVEPLRLGKVGASWTLLTRTPVYLDPVRAGAAFREVLMAAADAAGEGGRLSIRIHQGPSEAFPVRAEIEIGRRNAEPDQLPFLVAKHLLEAQGAVVEIDGRMTRIDLRCIVAERRVG